MTLALWILQTSLHLCLLLLAPPLLIGLINRIKALMAGRRGPPLLQLYYDLYRLWNKSVVYSSTTTWVFRLAPVLVVASALTCGLLIPLQSTAGPLDFEGAVLACAALLGCSRLALTFAALDTGSSFEGMGASREVSFSALAEPAFFLGLALLCIPAGSLSFAGALGALPWEEWGAGHPEYMVAAVVLFAVMLTENSRMPVDDPNTHLELTMVHEVMILDHSGPDLAMILYGSSVKLFVFASLIAHVLLPVNSNVVGIPVFLVGITLVGVLIGLTESLMGRLRLVRVPQFLVGASVLALVALGVIFFRGFPQ